MTAAQAVNEAMLGVPTEWFPSIGAVGLLSLTVWMILTGRLVPGKERDYWRSTAKELERQNGELIDGGKVTQDALRALQEALRRESPL